MSGSGMRLCVLGGICVLFYILAYIKSYIKTSQLASHKFNKKDNMIWVKMILKNME